MTHVLSSLPDRTLLEGWDHALWMKPPCSAQYLVNKQSCKYMLNGFCNLLLFFLHSKLPSSINGYPLSMSCSHANIQVTEQLTQLHSCAQDCVHAACTETFLLRTPTHRWAPCSGDTPGTRNTNLIHSRYYPSLHPLTSLRVACH